MRPSAGRRPRFPLSAVLTAFRLFLRQSRPVLLVALLAVAACSSPPAPPAGEVADLVLLGGKIVTMEEGAGVVEALAAKGGRIVALGSRSEVEAMVGESTEVIELDGRLAIPGFIESHGHFLGLGDARIQLDLRTAASWEEVVEQVAEAAAAASPGQWIRGRGWHQSKWSQAPAEAVQGFPVHQSLSAASPDNPVLLTHASGHALMANEAAMALAGIDETTPDPSGGQILRAASGAATGLFNETAQGLIQAARAADGDGASAEAVRMIELASQECLAKGVTSFQDAGSSFEAVDLLRQAANDGSLGVRLWVMIRDQNERLAERLASYRIRGEAGDFFSVGGIKVSIDGALGSRGAWLLEPYSDEPSTSGLNLVSLEETAKTAALALEHDFQLCIHAIGDRGNREILDLYERTFAANPEKTDLRWRIEHAQHLALEDIPRFAELGVIASVQGVHCTSDGPWVPERLGDLRSEEGAYVWRKLIESGAHLINGTDVPVEDVSPIASFYASVSRRMASGETFYPDQVMTRMEALASYTKNAAWAVFEEDLKGTLAVGKLADIAVLSRDILEVPEEDIPGTEILYTIVDGKVAYRHGA